MIINLPEDVRHIINKLADEGYEAYAVGGCVRDSVIGRVPDDWDITTSARPEDVKRIFRRTVDTGIEHGTVTVMIGREGYEVTTFRIDGEYKDSRHPENVEFTASLKEDLKRRDFTINAMAYNEQEGIVDLFGGMDDIRSGIIRCVGNPADRFAEDALRMLRAVRFSAQLGYDIDKDTAAAIEELAGTIAAVSKERIHTEIGKTIMSSHPEYIEKACRLGITPVVFGEFDRIDDKELSYKLIRKMPMQIAFRYAALLFAAGEHGTRRMLRELKLDNATVDLAVILVKYHGIQLTEDEYIIRCTASKTGADRLHDILKFEKLFYETAGDTLSAHMAVEEDRLLGLIEARKECLSIHELAINGSDLISMGMQPGRQLGIMLDQCLKHVLAAPEDNTYDTLKELVRKLM